MINKKKIQIAQHHHTGQDIRDLRKLRDVTLNELALQLGRSSGWLSQVERGHNEPSVDDLRQISKIFNIPISFFFRNEAAPRQERGRVVRAQSRVKIGSRESGLTEELLSPDISGDFEMIRSIFQPGSKSDTMVARTTQDAGYIMSGNLTITLSDEKFELNAGDSFSFKNEIYSWCNNGTSECVVVWVVSPPIY